VKITHRLKVVNELGLHARPAATIVKILQNVKSDVSFTCKGETINAKSIMSILMLAIKKNSMIKVVVQGKDADYVIDRLVTAFKNKFEGSYV
jgi:phosphocarrier protein HPr